MAVVDQRKAQRPTLEPGKFQWGLHAAVERARSIETRRFELDDNDRVRSELLPAAIAAIDGTLTILDSLLEHYDTPTDITSPQDSGVFNMMFEDIVEEPCASGNDEGRQRIADVSFMARWELVRKRKSVEAAVRLDDRDLIAACCSARRRVIKAVSGVERVLSAVEDRPSVFANLYQTERQRAVETRTAYLRFIAGLRRVEVRIDELGVERSLRLIGTGIAAIVGRSIYEELRIEDRRRLHELQTRLFTWLRGDRDEREGKRLIGDVSACAGLLMEVNRRPSLIEHDREVLDRLLSALEQPGTDKAAFYRVLKTIRGRDAELDRRLDEFADLRPELWLQPARRVLAMLSDQWDA